jgi:hypothetical protein
LTSFNLRIVASSPRSASVAPENTFVIDGSHARTTQGLFAEFATKLRFPDYFGYNWDAFEECLLDFLVDGGREDDAALTIVIEKARYVLADAEEGELATLLEILKSALAQSAEIRKAGSVTIELTDDADGIQLLQKRLGR